MKFFLCLHNFFELWNLCSRVLTRNRFFMLIQASINILEGPLTGAQILVSSPYFLVNPPPPPPHTALFSLEIPIPPTIQKQQEKEVTHLNTNPRSDQYLRHAHSHITRAVAAMDSCFGLVRPHQHGIAVEQKRGLRRRFQVNLIIQNNYCPKRIGLFQNKIHTPWQMGSFFLTPPPPLTWISWSTKPPPPAWISVKKC